MLKLKYRIPSDLFPTWTSQIFLCIFPTPRLKGTSVNQHLGLSVWDPITLYQIKIQSGESATSLSLLVFSLSFRAYKYPNSRRSQSPLFCFCSILIREKTSIFVELSLCLLAFNLLVAFSFLFFLSLSHGFLQ